MTFYFLPELFKQRLREISRGSMAHTIPPNCEITDININGYVRNLSDWLAVVVMDVYTFAERCRPGRPVAVVLGLKPERKREYLDNFAPCKITLPTKLSQLKRRITKFRRYITAQERANIEVTHIASQLMFTKSFKAWKIQKPFNSTAQDYYSWANVLKDKPSLKNFDDAVALLIRHGFLMKMKEGYMPTAYAIDNLFTERIWLLGAMQKLNWLQEYSEIDPLKVYSPANLMKGRSPGYELFRYYCKVHKIKLGGRIILGRDLLNVLSFLDEHAAVDYSGEKLPTSLDRKGIYS